MNKRVLLYPVLLLAFASCLQRQGEIEQVTMPEAPTEKTIHFSTRQISTKTAFGEAVTNGNGDVTYPCYWTSNDTQVKISLNYEYAVVAGVNTDETDTEGNIIRSSFDASFSGIDTPAPYSFYLVSPADALLWASADRNSVSVSINANQTPTAGSVDEAAQILVSKSDSYTTLPDNVEVDFSHITSYGKLTLTNLAVPQGAELTSITLISESQPISGAWYYSFADNSIQEKEGSSSIVINTANIDVAAGDPVWFAAAPVEMAGKQLTVRANFSDASYLERTITLNSNFNFASGKIIKFSVNMANATAGSNQIESQFQEVVYSLALSSGSLKAGDEVIIANSTTPTYAMTGSSSTSGLAGVQKDAPGGFTLGSDGHIRLASYSTVKILTVKSISGSSIVLWDGSKYLYMPTSGSSKYLQMSASSTTWTLSISNGAATLSTGSWTKYYIQLSSGYFNASNTSNTCAIYKKTAISSSSSIDLTNDPVCNYSDFGAYLAEKNLVYNASTDQTSREYGQNGTLTFSIIAPVEGQALEFSGIPSSAGLGDTFTLGLTFISGITTEINRSYSVYVVKEEGHNLWLTDGQGNGFIVKR
ncbi:MAG: hypothetical protein J6S97_07300 [Bacteroidales bacterium]|nr:hypothetical protein [Bacteroidales bacterium]